MTGNMCCDWPYNYSKDLNFIGRWTWKKLQMRTLLWSKAADEGLTVKADAVRMYSIICDLRNFWSEKQAFACSVANVFTHRNRLLIAVCYQHPNSAAADRFLFRMCCSYVINDFLSDASTTILFVGDFNDHSVGEPFQQQTELFRLFNMFNFHQVIQSPTRCTNILDLVCH